MPYFTKEQEERAVTLILKECNFCDHGDNRGSGVRNMSYVERDNEGYVVGLVDLGLQRLSTVVPNDKNGDNSMIQTPVSTSTTTRHWSMPHAIGYLTRLRKLTVYHCKSLPREIIHLAESLQEIAFHFCDELDFDAMPPEFESLEELTDFRIHGRTGIGRTTQSQRILPIHRLQNFSKLRFLYYRGGPSMDSNDIEKEKQEIHFMLHRAFGVPRLPDANSRLIWDLVSDNVKFKKSLEILEIEGGNLTEFTVADIFSEVLPKYPNLKRLILPNNKIRSLTPIIAQQPSVLPPSVRLRCFYLLGNPVLDVEVNSPRLSPTDKMLLLRPEQGNLLRLLSLYEEISSLGHGITESNLCTTEMLLALDLNDGGKVLLSERFETIPLSVWPAVLERVNQRKGYYESTNVLYHLLRNGPAMGKRYESKPTYCFPPVSSTNADAVAAIDAIIGAPGAPVAHYIAGRVVVTPMTPTMMRKRKISMP